METIRNRAGRRLYLTATMSVAIGLMMSCNSMADVGGGRIVTEYAEKAISKGYGSMCSLSMEPVRTGGYYPCLDFGPYRYVRGYENVSAYVVQKGKTPFRIMSGPPGNPAFVVAGPWVQDLPIRMVSFWNEVVEGGTAKRKAAEEVSGRQKAAEAYIKSLSEKERPVPVKRSASVEGASPKQEAAVPVEAEIGKPVDPVDLQEALQAVR